MNKFRYYVSSIEDGDVKGTNDMETAKLFSCSEYHIVVDTETSEWLLEDGTRQQVEEIEEVES